VLFSAVDGYGHVYPLLPLAAAFRRMGDEVLVATGPELAPVVGKRGLAVRTVGGTIAAAEREFLERHPDAPSLEPAARLALVAPEMFVAIAARDRLAGLLDVINAFRPDLVVHDATEFAAPVAAAATGVPAVAHAVSMLNPTAAVSAAVRARLDELGDEWGVPGATDRLLEQRFLDICPPTLAAGVRPNPFREVRALRPQLLPDSVAALPAEVRSLPRDRTVLVTLGTVVHRVPAVLETLVDAVQELPVNVVVTVGPDGDPARLGRRPANVHVARYLPFAALIPRCAALVAHAGAGTLLASLAAGVPSVLVPQGAEQVANALAAQRTGAAIAFEPGTLDAAAIRAALEHVVDAPQPRRAAAALAAEIASMPAASIVAREIQRSLVASPAKV
jgi:UDP:flavonoid glycosyltransferase YjiC (YdhE family)